MIKNAKQAGLTKTKLAELKEAKAKIEVETSKSAIQKQLGLNSVNAMIDDLEQELNEYECLTKGNLNILKPKDIKDLPHVIIAVRLAKKMSQEDLGKRIGVAAQQIQRYEATDYESVSYSRLVDVCLALGIDFTFEKHIVADCLEEMFLIPEGMTAEKINAAEEKVLEHHSLMF
jgi:HTH-type transcriptional regulator/antitoxin HigA